VYFERLLKFVKGILDNHSTFGKRNCFRVKVWWLENVLCNLWDRLPHSHTRIICLCFTILQSHREVSDTCRSCTRNISALMSHFVVDASLWGGLHAIVFVTVPCFFVLTKSFVQMNLNVEGGSTSASGMVSEAAIVKWPLAGNSLESFSLCFDVLFRAVNQVAVSLCLHMTATQS